MCNNLELNVEGYTVKHGYNGHTYNEFILAAKVRKITRGMSNLKRIVFGIPWCFDILKCILLYPVSR